jgi:hypothetical protein
MSPWPLNFPVPRIEHQLVDVTPAPFFARLERFHNRVVGRVEMLGRVAILRVVAAADVAADHAEAQVQPPIAQVQALFATITARRDFLDLIDMLTGFHHSPYSGGRANALCDELARHHYSGSNPDASRDPPIEVQCLDLGRRRIVANDSSGWAAGNFHRTPLPEIEQLIRDDTR